MTIEHDLSALNFRPVQVRAVKHQQTSVWVPSSYAYSTVQQKMENMKNKQNMVNITPDM